MSLYGYWAACESAKDEPACGQCGSYADPYTAATCWVDGETTCEDCVDAHGYPCSHYSE